MNAEPKRDICSICGGTYPKTRDGYNIHSGTDKHRLAVAKATGRLP